MDVTVIISPFCLITRWQGIATASLFDAQAFATAR